jgi:outer membrane lipoprotein LolB
VIQGITRRAALLVIAATLAACASSPPARGVRQVHQGRFSATFNLSGRTENNTGRFALAIYGDGLTLDLASPLGNSVARIETSPGRAKMSYVDANGNPQTAQGTNADDLAQKILGWRVPMSGIRDWIDGRPDPARPSTSLSDGGFEQGGWTVRVLERFAADGAPRLLAFERPATPDSPAVNLRLVLEEPSA